MLTRVDDDLVDPRLAERDGERRRLDELRAVADDGEDAHRASVVPLYGGRLTSNGRSGRIVAHIAGAYPPRRAPAGRPERRTMGQRRTRRSGRPGRWLMPQLREDLARLVAIPSVSATGYPPETHAELIAARDAVVELLEGAGVENIRSLELPDTAPVVLGEIPAPEGAPTVLLYGHYDVVPAGDEEKWDSPPFEADRARRRPLRTRVGRHEVEHRRARRRAARVGGASRPSGSRS